MKQMYDKKVLLEGKHKRSSIKHKITHRRFVYLFILDLCKKLVLVKCRHSL